jgi:hypothetical protein
MVRDSSRMWRSSSRAILTRALLLGACQAARDPAGPLLRQQSAARQGLLGPEVVQVPEQVIVEGGAHPNEPFAVIDQQPDLELDARQLGNRQPIKALPQRGTGDGERVDAIRLAALAAAAALPGHQPRRDPHHALAVDQQESLERARDVAAVLQRPYPLGAQPARPIHHGGEPALADVNGLVAEQLAGCRRDRGDRVRALVHVRTEHDHGLRPFHLD